MICNATPVVVCTHQVVAAAVAGPQASMIPSPAADMWSLGVLGFEMMSGQPLFGTQYSNNDVVAMLLGYSSHSVKTDVLDE